MENFGNVFSYLIVALCCEVSGSSMLHDNTLFPRAAGTLATSSKRVIAAVIGPFARFGLMCLKYHTRSLDRK
jgi:hypothetical protein